MLIYCDFLELEDLIITTNPNFSLICAIFCSVLGSGLEGPHFSYGINTAIWRSAVWESFYLVVWYLKWPVMWKSTFRTFLNIVGVLSQIPLCIHVIFESQIWLVCHVKFTIQVWLILRYLDEILSRSLATILSNTLYVWPLLKNKNNKIYHSTICLTKRKKSVQWILGY